MPHLGVEEGEEAKQEVGPDQVREVEGYIPPRKKEIFHVELGHGNL